MDWEPIKKPIDIAQSRLIEAILSHEFEINSYIPAERELAANLGVTRPTLREALKRLERDGWVEIHQGKSTRIRNYWQEGNLGLLSALTEKEKQLSPDFVKNLLSVRKDLAPSYTYLAVKHNHEKLIKYLHKIVQIADDPNKYVYADWYLHHILTVLSENPIYTLILNGFKDLYLKLGLTYFSLPEARKHSSIFYTDLQQAANDHNPDLARTIVENVMEESIQFWQRAYTVISIGGDR